MDHFQKLRSQISRRVFVLILIGGLLATIICAGLIEFFYANIYFVAGVGIFITMVFAAIISHLVATMALEPVKILRQAILHVSPEHQEDGPPNLDTIKLGRELITSLALQVYQMASKEADPNETDHRKAVIQSINIVSRLPLPLFVFNKELLVTNASDKSFEYCQVESSALLGKPLFDSLDLEFKTDLTLEKWIAECQNNRATDTAYWERVRVHPKRDENTIMQCDIAAYYNRDSPSGTEFIVTLFDRSERYGQDDDAMSFVSLAVHELRTPLTLLRGYIEVFEEEFAGKLDPELTDFMAKMQNSSQQLTSFVNNILNVSRVENSELVLSLNEETWPTVINKMLDDLSLKAKVHGKTIERNITPNLPTVGIDHVSIYEVVSNLLDNAIKYSGESTRIIVSSTLGKNGLVETTVQDFGTGMPSSVLTGLFEKFYRNHRTSGKVSGTGLGLYLSKAIVNAHGGQIWATSKEGEGSTFGFSLLPYSQLADEQKNGNNTDIVRQTHGWVKNHSLYRR